MYHFVQPGIPALTAWLAHAPTTLERESARLIARNLAGALGFLHEADRRDLYVRFLAGLRASGDSAHLPLDGHRALRDAARIRRLSRRLTHLRLSRVRRRR
jgi:hypothetical protein